MKLLQSILLFLVTGLSLAADENAAISHAVDARIAMLQAESWQLDSAIYALTNLELTENEKFELIAEAGFRVTEETLAGYGFTLKQLYAFEAEYQAAITAWLEAHPDQAYLLTTLENEIESRQNQFEQVIGLGTSQ